MAKKGGAKAAAAKARAKGKRTTAETVGSLERDLLKQLDGRKGVTGGIWKPAVIGDTIVGQVLSMRAEKGAKYDNLQVVMVIGTPDGARTVYANWSLQQALINEKVNVGDTIGIRYTEDVPGRGRPMRAFAVVRKGGAGKKLADVLTEILEADKKGSAKKKKSKR